MPPRQGLWPGHPSGPLPAAPPSWPTPPAGSFPTGPRSRHPSGPLPTPRTRPRPAASAKPLAPTSGTTRLVLPALVLSVIGLGAVAVIALWWHSTPPITGTGDLLTDAGDVLGLLAGYGVVVLVALMARLPPLEKRHRRRPAGPLACHGRPVRHHRGHRARRVHRLGLRRHRAGEGDQRGCLAGDDRPRRADGDRLLVPAAWRRRVLDEGRAAPAIATRPGTTRTCTPTWRSRSRSATSSPSAPRSKGATRPGWLGRRCTRWSAALLLWYRVITPLRSAARHRFTVQSVRPEAPGHRVGADRRA